MQWSPLISRITIERCQDCLSLTRSLFVLLPTVKQFIHLKWPLNILNHISRSHLLMSSRIKHYWFFQFFWNGDLHIFPQKKRTWSERSRLFCNRFLIVNVFDNLQYTSFQNVLNHWSLVHIKDSTHHVWKLPWTGMAKANSNYV